MGDKGDKGRQGETRGDKTSGRRTHHPTKGNKKGDKRREDLGKAEGGHLKKALRTPNSTLFGEKHNSNHLSVHQCLRSAIRDSQQPTSPIGFLFLKLPPPPCAVLLVYNHRKMDVTAMDVTAMDVSAMDATAMQWMPL